MEMSAEAKEARRIYRRNWNRQNKDKCKEYMIRYWNRRAEREQAENQEKDTEV